MSDVTVDTSELDELEAILQRAAERTTKERARALREAGEGVAREARANASSWFTKASTGELAASIETAQRGVSEYRVFANVRQAFFLEYGSPNTGGPRPWLSEPAEKGAERLLTELGKAGDLW